MLNRRLQETQWAVKQKRKGLRYTLAKTKRQSLTSITRIDGAYRTSCYINAEILPPFASDTRCTGFHLFFEPLSGCSGSSSPARALPLPFLFSPHCPFLIFLFNIPSRSCATSVYSLINGTSALVSGTYIVLYIHRIMYSNSNYTIPLSLFELKRGELEGIFSYISSQFITKL